MDSSRLRIVIVGHVDHGKSTLVGRLFHDTGSLPEGKLEQLRRAAERRGVPFEWANLMDGLQSERDQNITIDTAQIWFRTQRRQYVLIDAPGHEEFLKNMITGAAGAETALLLIDAHEGVRENSRRHGTLLHLLGVRQVAVLINKMDLVGYREDRFRAIEAEYRAWLSPLGIAPHAFIPIVARDGDTVAVPGAHMPWYSGPTLLEALDTFEPPDRPTDRPLRFPVQDVYRFDDRRILAGRVESGTLRVGDRLVFSPSQRTGTVRTIERWNAPVRDEAALGESVGITLHEQLFIERGAIAAAASDPPREAGRLRARVFWLSRKALRPGRRYKLKLGTSETDCEVDEIESILDPSTLATRPGGRERRVAQHEIAEVVLRLRRPVAFDIHEATAATGRFVIVDGYDAVGAGIVTGAVDDDARSAALRPGKRSGHVLWLTGASADERRSIAAELEHELVTVGRPAIVLDAESSESGLWSDLAVPSGNPAETLRRIAEVAKLFERAGVLCITALDLSRPDARDNVRRLIPEDKFVEVHLSATPEIRPTGTPAAALEIRIDRFHAADAVRRILAYLDADDTDATRAASSGGV